MKTYIAPKIKTRKITSEDILQASGVSTSFKLEKTTYSSDRQLAKPNNGMWEDSEDGDQ